MLNQSKIEILGYDDFAKIFLSNMVTNIGFWLSTIAVYSIFIFQTQVGAVAIGTLAFVGAVPRIFASPVLGAIVDRADRRSVIYISEFTSAVLIAILYTYTSLKATYIIYFLLGMLTAISDPAHEAIIPQIITKDEDLAEANGLMSLSESIAQIVGPAAAGALLTVVSAKALLIIDSTTYLISGIVIFTTNSYIVDTSGGSLWGDIRQGLHKLYSSANLIKILLAGVLLFATIAPFEALITMYIRDILSADSSVYGTAVGLTAGGAFIAGIVINQTGDSINEYRILPFVLILTGISMLSHTLILRVEALFVLSFFMGGGTATSAILMTTIIQKDSKEEYHGRILSIFSSSTESTQSVFMIIAALATVSLGILNVFRGSGLLLILGGVLLSITKLSTFS